jgi:hypothetical protein
MRLVSAGFCELVPLAAVRITELALGEPLGPLRALALAKEDLDTPPVLSRQWPLTVGLSCPRAHACSNCAAHGCSRGMGLAQLSTYTHNTSEPCQLHRAPCRRL